MKNLKRINLSFLFICMTFIFSGCSIQEYWKKAVLGNMPVVKKFIQKNYNTYTSITGIKDEMKLVTAKQQIDFINIMDGKNGRYLEVSTFEVKAGIDCSKIILEKDENGLITKKYPPVEIFSSSKIHSVVPRKEADKSYQLFYENSIKPVNIAYEQKAKDYAVELGLLKNAKKGAEITLKKLINSTESLDISKYKISYEVKYLPFTLDIEGEYFDKHKMIVEPIRSDRFYRDSFVLQSKSNDGWTIRIGDSGRTFSGTFEEFYQNVFSTNSNKNNYSNDRIEIFRYFDPMYPKECEILGYASDSFRTMFLLNNGRIYYVDAVVDSEQTLINDLAPTVVYLASSLRKITDYKVDQYSEYQQYISNYFDVQETIRTNGTRIAIKTTTDKLIASNLIATEDSDLTLDEKYFAAVSDVKCLGRTPEQITVTLTGNQDFDEITNLIKDLLVSKDNFSSNETRDKAIEVAASLDTRIYHENNKKSANTQYLETWFLQNNTRFDLAPEVRKRYEDDIKSGETYIASRPMIAILDDTQRNEYYYSLFRNHLSMSHYFVDTAEVIDDKLKKSVRGTNMFVYYNLPEFEENSDGDIYEQLKKQNSDREINNSFIFIFSQREWDWGNLGGDNDIHAIVLDDSTLRFFPNVGAISFVEASIDKLNSAANTIMDSKIGKVMAYIISPVSAVLIDGMRTKNNVPVYFYFGDWKNLRITPENVTIAGHSFATKKITKRGKSEYRNTNDYAEKSVIGSVIDDIQHAYSNDDADYYFNVLCDNLDYQIQRYVYDRIFRPSPRMILDVREDPQHRYNR